MTAYLYRDFIRTLAGRVRSALSTIGTEHNFEYGAEFEIATCEALRDMLADRFGITRGYAVDASGNSGGDAGLGQPQFSR